MDVPSWLDDLLKIKDLTCQDLGKLGQTCPNSLSIPAKKGRSFSPRFDDTSMKWPVWGHLKARLLVSGLVVAASGELEYFKQR
jgi:hypothetical protein